MSVKIDFSARARDEYTWKMGTKTCQRHQKTAENLLSPPRLCKNVGSCNFLCLFPCSLTYLMFPCSLRFFLLCSLVPIAKFPVFLCSPKTPGGPSEMLGIGQISENFFHSWTNQIMCYQSHTSQAPRVKGTDQLYVSLPLWKKYVYSLRWP